MSALTVIPACVLAAALCATLTAVFHALTGENLGLPRHDRG